MTILNNMSKYIMQCKMLKELRDRESANRFIVVQSKWFSKMSKFVAIIAHKNSSIMINTIDGLKSDFSLLISHI